jgi:hypothetical protein
MPAVGGEGPVIAVDLKASFSRRNQSASAAAISRNEPERPEQESVIRGANGATRQRHPLHHSLHSPRTPSLGEVVTRVQLLGSQNTSDAARRHAELRKQAVSCGCVLGGSPEISGTIG